MKKFKIKNRQKRKYIRKTHVVVGRSITHSIVTMSIPMLFLSLAVLGMFTLSTITPTTSVTMTSLTYELPDLPNIALPRSDVTSFTILLNTLQVQFILGLQYLQQQFGIMIQTFAKTLPLGITFLATLLTSFTQQLVFVMLLIIKHLTQFFSFSIESTTTYYLFISHSVIQAVSVMSIAITMVTTSLVNGIITVSIAIGQILMTTLLWAITFITMLVQTLVLIIQTVIRTVIAWGNAVIDFIVLPFKLLEMYIEKMRPFFSGFGHLIQQATTDFTGGFKSIGELYTTLAKN